MIEAGLEATVEEIVTESMTASALGSGDVPVLGTPAILALVERAACAAIERRLGDGETSVGSWVELSHLAPTPVGREVTARAKLTEATGRKLAFEFTVSDGSGRVATGTHRRVIVPREEFLRSAESR